MILDNTQGSDAVGAGRRDFFVLLAFLLLSDVIGSEFAPLFSIFIATTSPAQPPETRVSLYLPDPRPVPSYAPAV